MLYFRLFEHFKCCIIDFAEHSIKFWKRNRVLYFSIFMHIDARDMSPPLTFCCIIESTPYNRVPPVHGHGRAEVGLNRRSLLSPVPEEYSFKKSSVIWNLIFFISVWMFARNFFEIFFEIFVLKIFFVRPQISSQESSLEIWFSQIPNNFYSKFKHFGEFLTLLDRHLKQNIFNFFTQTKHISK